MPETSAWVLSGGGPLAVAWEWGLIAGLSRTGLVLNASDFILGTSAGAMVGAQLAAGCNPMHKATAIIAERSGLLPADAMPAYPPAALTKLSELFGLSQTSDAGRRDVGAYALAASTVESEPRYLDRMASLIGMEQWPQRDVGLVAVSTSDGEPTILRRNCGATVAAAVAASCSLPGLSPPVSIAGRRYMDGGTRSTANADLAVGYDTVLVLCFHPPGAVGERILARTQLQSAVLIKAGARVNVITPDEPSLAAIGSRTMDVSRRPDVAGAGLAQGEGYGAGKQRD